MHGGADIVQHDALVGLHRLGQAQRHADRPSKEAEATARSTPSTRTAKSEPPGGANPSGGVGHDSVSVGPSTTALAADAPATVADVRVRQRSAHRAVQIAPCASQSVVGGSDTVTSPLPEGSTWISRRSLRPSLRRALTTSPPVTSNDSSRSTR